MKKAICILFIGLTLTGCQTIVDEEYYDITEANKTFAVKGKDGSASMGPLKRRSNKKGANDWSPGKHLEVNAIKAGSIGI